MLIKSILAFNIRRVETEVVARCVGVEPKKAAVNFLSRKHELHRRLGMIE